MIYLSDKDLQQLYRYSLALTNNSEMAYDLVHEALIKVENKIIFYKQAYLRKTIRNLFLNQRTHSNKFSIEPDLDSVADPSDIASMIITRNDLQQLLNFLNAEERELLFLAYVEEKSYQEIAKELQIKLGTVMSRINRCKEKIRRLQHEKCQG